MSQHERDYESEFALWLLGIALSIATVTLIIGMVLQPVAAAPKQRLDQITVWSYDGVHRSLVRAAYTDCRSQFTVSGASALLDARCAGEQSQFVPTQPDVPDGSLLISAAINDDPLYVDCRLVAAVPTGAATNYSVVCA